MFEIIFQYQFLTIKTLHIFLVASFITGIFVLIRFAELKKMKLNFLVDHFTYFIVVPLVVGRIFYVFEELSLIKQSPLQALTLWDFRFSEFGMLYSFLTILYIFSLKKREDFWLWLDAFTLAGLASLTLLHIGYFFDGSNYGTVTDMPWGITFNNIKIPFLKPIHPTQLYSAGVSFAIFSFLIRYVKRTHLTGMAGNLGFMIYSLCSFGIDFFHGSPSSYDRVNYIIIAAIAFVFYVHCSHRKLLS